MSSQGIVFNIQRFSIHDGPGIRTTVFLKGCNNRCVWCHNPESYEKKPEFQYFPERCIGCGQCFSICVNGVHAVINGARVLKRCLCTNCGKCVEACYSGALEMAGRFMSADQVMEEVIKDKVYYGSSNGGVTFSGGEPLLQKDFLKELLLASKSQSIHTAVQTAGNYEWSILESVLPLIDFIMYDLKIYDNDKHVKYTGVGNTRILKNLKLLSETDKVFAVRTPVIADINDSPEEISKIAETIKGFPGLLYYELIPYHNLGASKYRYLGKEYIYNFSAPANEKLRLLANAASIHMKNVRC